MGWCVLGRRGRGRGGPGLGRPQRLAARSGPVHEWRERARREVAEDAAPLWARRGVRNPGGGGVGGWGPARRRGLSGEGRARSFTSAARGRRGGSFEAVTVDPWLSSGCTNFIGTHTEVFGKHLCRLTGSVLWRGRTSAGTGLST